MVSGSDDRIGEARRRLSVDDSKGAERLLLDVLSDADGWTDARGALLELAEVYANDGDRGSLELLTSEALAANPMDSRLVIHLARRFFLLPSGDDARARAMIAAALSSGASSASTRHEASLVLALLACRAKRPDEATMHITTAREAALDGAEPDSAGLAGAALDWVFFANDVDYRAACAHYATSVSRVAKG
jgi:hypothetical protein